MGLKRSAVITVKHHYCDCTEDKSYYLVFTSPRFASTYLVYVCGRHLNLTKMLFRDSHISSSARCYARTVPLEGGMWSVEECVRHIYFYVSSY
jgi:hypothetical protein